ncbi:MAG: iron-sulfur cluster repair di-iron protein [Chitinophagales bacterium]|nr:iron-sulfur cluster repair di-iron protein [Chitinophagales bacterium]MCO5280152.1 iron-sulfur cluster repair di-iron protein [Chitinophagales bacterium]OJV25465.1 MAG: iron-sulfur cluster repair di-iron protein [Bacteroidetes bacterium 37-13]HRN95328.1 iron-sulfur cluster repair di-iron protein [Chitinophagales bacterium]HRP38048.1 iron-sulfur cluster repair di-iron protein [Chitinophagales bacterium]
MNITKDTNIGDLVAQNYKTASVFKQNGIDFCCNGNRSIGDACTNKNIDTDKVLSELAEVSKQASGANIDYASWPLDLLADYIEKKHHRYVESKASEIKPFLAKIANVHGGRHPELLEVEQLFNESVGELAMHMKREELVLFPYIRKMVTAANSGTSVQAPFGTVQNPIQNMMHEHDTEGERFRKISKLTNDYTTPADGCNTYKVTFAMLKEFEDDLHLHIHLENNILFPKSIELEEKLNAVTQ